MKTLPASPSGATGARATTASRRGVLVWDAPVRVFHWLMVLCFAGAWLSAESDRWQVLHVTLGYTMAGLVLFRGVWGLVGTHHARFANFVRGPGAVAYYARDLLHGQPQHHTGHNPLGALAIVAMLGLTLAIVGSGWLLLSAMGGNLFEELHEGAASALMAVVALHVAGVLLTGRLHRENLVRAMFTGRKHAPPADAVQRAWRGVAVLLLVAVLGFWALQWRTAPAGVGLPGSAQRAGAVHGDDDDNDD